MKSDLEKVIEFPQKPQDTTLVKPTYDPLAPTIFHEGWWLDIVTGGNYKLAQVQENGEVIGRLPYFPRSRLGITYSIMPPMTHFVGPAIVEGEGNHTTKF